MNTLIAALRSARESWVEVEPEKLGKPAKQVKIRRPTEAEFPSFLKTTDAGRRLAVELEHVQRYVVDWRGFSEADLLGDSVGTIDALPFDAEVWSEVVADRVDWMSKAAQAIVETIVQHMTVAAAASGNSPATSTPGPAAGVANPTTTETTTTQTA